MLELMENSNLSLSGDFGHLLISFTSIPLIKIQLTYESILKLTEY